MASLHHKLGPGAEVRDLVELGVENMPKCYSYVDKSQNAEIFSILDEEPEVTSEWGENMSIQR